jgi:hypothetical protein
MIFEFFLLEIILPVFIVSSTTDGNNPLSYEDPFGLFAMPITLAFPPMLSPNNSFMHGFSTGATRGFFDPMDTLRHPSTLDFKMASGDYAGVLQHLGDRGYQLGEFTGAVAGVTAAAWGSYGLAKTGLALGSRFLLKPGMNFMGKEFGKKGFVDNINRATSWKGRKGFELSTPPSEGPRNIPATIQRRLYTRHALDQMQNRGLFPSVVEDTIKTGRMISSKKNSNIIFHCKSNNLTVISSPEGKVVSTFFEKI